MHVYYNNLLETKIDLEGIVIFNYNQELYNQHMTSPATIVESLGNTELFKHVELTVRTWSKQIERVCLYNIFHFNILHICLFYLLGVSTISAVAKRK